MLVTIHVTQEDIAVAERACPTHCMVAKTLSIVLRDDVEVYVTKGTITLQREHNLHSYILDREIGMRVMQFDLGLPVMDFDYTVDVPTVFLKDTVIGFYLLMEDDNENPLEIDIPDTITVPPGQDPQPVLPERELVPA